MRALVQRSIVRYAIVQVSSKSDHPERMVIGYPNENCLRDLIAEPSIVRLGFSSREEAMTKLADRTANQRPSEAKHRSIVMSRNPQPDRHAGSDYRFVKIRRSTCYILQCAFATITVLFYSRNLFSVILRTVLGISS
jgi:hypothetical protein